ncbi:MAG: SulP family inorganic anion transporter, partial [Chloroflexaceae bacterium]
MATSQPIPSPTRTGGAARTGGLSRYLPFTRWLLHYRRADLPSDLVAGVVTAIMLIPQSMAYAQLA